MATTILTKDMFAKMRKDVCTVEKEFVELKPGIGVYAAQLTVGGVLALGVMDAEHPERRIVNWVVASCVDEDLKPVFTAEDVESFPQDLAKTLTEAVFRVNKLISNDAVDTAEKN